LGGSGARDGERGRLPEIRAQRVLEILAAEDLLVTDGRDAVVDLEAGVVGRGAGCDATDDMLRHGEEAHHANFLGAGEDRLELEVERAAVAEEREDGFAFALAVPPAAER